MKIALFNSITMKFSTLDSNNSWVEDHNDAGIIETDKKHTHGSLNEGNVNEMFLDIEKATASNSEEVLELLIESINNTFDGPSIALAMTDITDNEYTYTEDSVWLVNDRTMDGDNLIETIAETELPTKELLRLCNKYSLHAVWKVGHLDALHICPTY